MQRATDDVTHLYQEFGGKPKNYREFTRAREAERARGRWPLLSRVEDLSSTLAVPPVQAGEDVSAEPLRWLAVVPAAQQPEPAVPESAQPTAERQPAGAEPESVKSDRNPAILPWLRQPGVRASTARTAPTSAPPAPSVVKAQVAPMFAALHKNPGPVAAAPAEVVAPAPALPPGVAPMFASLYQRTSSAQAPAARAVSAALAPVPSHGRAPAWKTPQPAQPSEAPLAPPPWTRAAQPAAPDVSVGPAPFTLQGRSPLARLGQPQTEPKPAPARRTSGLQNLFARLIGHGAS